VQDAGQVHNLNCSSNLATMQFDGACYRCKQIRLVVFLRRKANGGDTGEVALALEKAEAIRRQFRLTRGEIFDRQYEEVPTKVEDSPTARPTPQPLKETYRPHQAQKQPPRPQGPPAPRSSTSWFHTAPLKRGVKPQTTRQARTANRTDFS